MANPYEVTPPPAPRRRGSRLPGFLALVLVAAGIYGASQWLGEGGGGNDAKPSASASAPGNSSKDPGNPESSSDTSSTWAVGDCGGPDPDNKPDGYRPQKCSASGATFKAIDIKDASILPGAIQCPPGTDLMIQVSMTYGSAKSGGIPTNTVCGRNLTGEHPGDAGAGGGQLVQGDCVTDQAQEVPCASGGSGTYKVLGLVKTKAECPSGTTEPMRLTMAVGRPYDVICAKG
ncbi:hypothetical protein OHA37_21540 [Streptomyces sp. NBC_00335]|uniref:hypothetical protein n=1 Tax=unclassified Streptomyces TaxID=2593676 RepID=UPI00225B6948|nr:MULTISPECIES: hypothetical protein [unclassified Streptomyces]MCX5406446.1 hypothetical protein [Streptomyces sp. NBC_00086]